MMVAVHRKRIPTEQLVQGCSGQNADRMDGRVVGRLLMMFHGAGVLGGEILIERAAQQRVEQLMAAADAQHRLVIAQRKLQHQPLHPVAGLGAVAADGQLFLAIDGRRNVVAAGEQEAVAGGTQLFQVGRILRQRKHDGNAARLCDAVHVAGQHPEALQPVVYQWNQTDQRFHREIPSFARAGERRFF